MGPQHTRRRWSYAGGVIVCLFLGLLLGVGYSMVASVIWLVRGPQPFETVGASFSKVLGLYLLGFLVAGLVAGVLNPVARTKIGAVVLGALSVVPISVGAEFLITGDLSRVSDHLFAIGMMSATFGGGLGFAAWKEFVDHPESGGP
jgi:hypothetical protein